MQWYSWRFWRIAWTNWDDDSSGKITEWGLTTELRWTRLCWGLWWCRGEFERTKSEWTGK